MALGSDVQMAGRQPHQVVLFRDLLGVVLRGERMRRGMTLRELSAQARVSLGYISEIERGHKEASSELLAALCDALGLGLADVLRQVSDEAAALEVVATAIEVPSPDGDVVASAA